MQQCKSQASEPKSSKANEPFQLRLTSPPSNSYDYFIQGFELPPQQQAIRDRLLNHIPTLKTRSYRQSLLRIVSSISQLDHFSDNLQTKVDKLLQAQQSTFVQSYKQHIGKIQKQFDTLHKQISELQQKVRYYQNQGKMSALIKKVYLLQQQSAKLFKTMVIKDKKIKDQELTIAMLRKQMKILHETVKSNAREKSMALLLEKQRNEQDEDQEEEPIKVQDLTVFPTEPKKRNSIGSLQSPVDNGSTKNIDYVTSHKSVTIGISPDFLSNNLSNSKSKNVSFNEDKIYKQNRELRLKNKKLLTQQTRMIDHKSEMQQFFVRCVEQLRKQIKIRKKMEYCSYEDFKKQDKLMLMIKILSNQEILSYLYNRIFNKPSITKDTDSSVKDQKLPKLNFNLSYHKR